MTGRLTNGWCRMKEEHSMQEHNNTKVRRKNYDTVIVGGGAAGLFLGAVLRCDGARYPGIILEAAAEPGQKLLASGSGQCNFTRADAISSFLEHYGAHGARIRTCLRGFDNRQLISFFEAAGVPSWTREDGKVFPRSMRAADVREALLKRCRRNGWVIRCGCSVTALAAADEAPVRWYINGDIAAHHVVLASGGLSWGRLGRGGGILNLVQDLGIQVQAPRPALVPLYVRDYPFRALAGISFPKACVHILAPNGRRTAEKNGAVLLTHRGFSGPAILDISRWAAPGKILEIGFAEGSLPDHRGVKKSLQHYLAQHFGLPQRFLAALIRRCGGDPAAKAASADAGLVRRVSEEILGGQYVITGDEGFAHAMVTAGGMDLSEISTRSFECKHHPGLFACGEVLDVDGDTGGYNLQFAFSSAAAVARAIDKERAY